MIVLLRHGRTPNNAEALLQGQEDSPLDEVGHEQARLAGAYIRKRWAVDHLVVSPLARARQTAEAAELGPLPTTVDERWGEIDFGAYDQRRISEVIHELGDRWARDIDFVPPGGESMAHMHDRVVGAVSDVLANHAKENVVIVTHATPIKSVIAWALGGDARTILSLRIGLASVSTLERGAGGLLVSAFNVQPALDL